jgi:hypothetical protein
MICAGLNPVDHDFLILFSSCCMVVQFLEFEHLSKISTLTVMLMTVEYMHCPHIRFS